MVAKGQKKDTTVSNHPKKPQSRLRIFFVFECGAKLNRRHHRKRVAAAAAATGATRAVRVLSE